MKKYISYSLLFFIIGAVFAKFYPAIPNKIEAAPLAVESDSLIVLGGSANRIYDTVSDGTTTFIAGEFEYIGQSTGLAATLDSTSASLSGTFPKFGGNDDDTWYVNQIISDGASGWYVCGYFNRVNGEERSYLVHVNADGTVDESFDPDPQNEVVEIALSGSDLYAVGYFTSIGGQSRNRIAKLNATTGVADATWNPNANAAVRNIAISGSDIYVGGNFTGASSIGGQTRNYLAKLNNTDGLADATWNPAPNNSINDLQVTGSDIYVSGSFTNIGGQARNTLAKLNNTNGNADATWNPAPDSTAQELRISGSDIYVEGFFSTIGGQSRSRIAKLNNTNGNADATFNASNANGSIQTLEVSGSYVYVAGYFTNIGGATGVYGLNRLSTTNGTLDATWAPANSNYNYSPYTIAISGTKVAVGGDFNSIAGYMRKGVAAIDNATQTVTSWNASVNNEVDALALDGDNLYLGGVFTSVGGTSRTLLAMVNKNTGALDATWNPGATSQINNRGLYVNGDYVYVHGGFTGLNSIGGTTGETRNRLARVHKTSGALDTSWEPNPTGTVNHVAFDGTDIYVGGDFTGGASIGGQARDYIAKINDSTGAADATWNPTITGGGVETIVIDDESMYIGGTFTSVGGTGRNRGAKLAVSDGSLDTSWNPNFSDGVYEFQVTSDFVLAMGYFDTVGGESHEQIAFLNKTTGAALGDWDPFYEFYEVQNAVIDDNLLITVGWTEAINDDSTHKGLGFFTFPEVSFSSSTASGAEGAGQVEIPITLSAVSDLDTTFDYTITSGTATAGTDVTQTSGTITIAVGDTTEYLQLDLVDDSTPESDETFTITLSDPGNAFFGDNSSLIFTIEGESETTSTGSPAGGGGGSPVTPVVVPVSPEVPMIPTAPTVPSLVVPIGSKLAPFTHDLQYGSNGSDVTALQQFLNQRGFIVSPDGPGSWGKETIYFRNKTQEALKKFQQTFIETVGETNGILSSKTRDLVNFMTSF